MQTVDLASQAEQLAAGETTSVDLTERSLAAIDALQPTLNAFITVDRDGALTAAAAADQRRAAGQPLSSLDGVPIAHKDIFCTAGVKTTCGSRMLESFVPPYNATVVERLAAAGLVMVGKTNMDEFAMGSSNETSFYGNVGNPWDTTRSPGGSSGGSAAAVAAGIVAGATGTDTGGSIRQPAALCGITGFKPTYGRASRYGMIAFASSLDQAGTLTRTAKDAALLLDHLCGFDPKDSTSLDVAAESFSATLDKPLTGLRIGVAEAFYDDGLAPGCRDALEQALDQYRSLGASVASVELPHLYLSVPTYYVVAPAECSSNLSRFDGIRFGHRADDCNDLTELYTRSRSEGFGDEVKRRIMTGTYVLSSGYYDAYYLKAQRARQLISGDFAAAFEQVDLIAGPTAPTPAFGLGDKVDDPVTMYLNDIYTIGANLAGLPAMSLPMGTVDGLPVGMQLIGPALSEARLLNAAHGYQSVTEWHRATPNVFSGAES
ncbi:MAG: Asp-tRNA(Asn)/Glu-tRNA(Gln) amidotransferase subunit GatA [Pseudomonadota bacterium]